MAWLKLHSLKYHMKLLGFIIIQALAPLAVAATSRPNFIFIVCDDLSDAIGVYGGHPQTKTPEMDRLARSGVIFRNAASSVPLCGPSRISFLTGLAPQTSGYYGQNFLRDHWANNKILGGAVTMMEHFRNNGYRALGTGKVFHNHQNKLGAWDEFGVLESWGPWPYDGTTDSVYTHGEMSPWGNAAMHPSKPALGMDTLFSRLSDVPNVSPDPAKHIPGYNGWRLFHRPYRYVSEEDRDPMPDELNAQWAAQKLRERQDKPFMMVIGINRPHSPMVAPDTYFDRFPLESVQLAETRPNDLDDIAERIKSPDALLETYGFEKYERMKKLGYLKAWTQAYLANVAFVDDQIGKIMRALETSAYADNTYVILTSDNGYHLGEKFYLHKDSLWEESCRVPLIVKGPGLANGRECTVPVSLVDLYPTFNELAGLEPEPNVSRGGPPLDGHSLVSLLREPDGSTWTGPEFVVTAVHGLQNLSLGEPGRAENQHYSFRTASFRYLRLSDGSEELYDHRTDPGEWTNLIRRQGYGGVLENFRKNYADYRQHWRR